MTDFIPVASVADVPTGRAKTYSVAGRKIVLIHIAAGFFAADNTCPHRGGPLGEGDVISNEIVCPWHLWGFDAATGLCGGNPDIRLVTHEVRIGGDRVFVRLAPARETADLS